MSKSSFDTFRSSLQALYNGAVQMDLPDQDYFLIGVDTRAEPREYPSPCWVPLSIMSTYEQIAPLKGLLNHFYTVVKLSNLLSLRPDKTPSEQFSRTFYFGVSPELSLLLALAGEPQPPHFTEDPVFPVPVPPKYSNLPVWLDNGQLPPESPAPCAALEGHPSLDPSCEGKEKLPTKEATSSAGNTLIPPDLLAVVSRLNELVNAVQTYVNHIKSCNSPARERGGTN